MLKLPVLHPEILSALGSAGHLATVLISDGNYPHNTKPNPRAKIVWANFVPGVTRPSGRSSGRSSKPAATFAVS
jgi:L-fucose mutarotase